MMNEADSENLRGVSRFGLLGCRARHDEIGGRTTAMLAARKIAAGVRRASTLAPLLVRYGSIFNVV